MAANCALRRTKTGSGRNKESPDEGLYAVGGFKGADALS